MHGVGRFRHNFSLIGLISFPIVKAVNSLHFSCLSFFVCMLGQESYLSKTTFFIKQPKPSALSFGSVM